MDAGYQGWAAFSAASTLRVSASTRIRASATTGDPDSEMTAHAAAKAIPNVDGREIIRFTVRSLLLVLEGASWLEIGETPRGPRRPIGPFYTEDRPKSKTSVETGACNKS